MGRCGYCVDRTLTWIGLNKRLTFFGLLSFSLFISTIALAATNSRLRSDIGALRNAITEGPPEEPPKNGTATTTTNTEQTPDDGTATTEQTPDDGTTTTAKPPDDGTTTTATTEQTPDDGTTTTTNTEQTPDDGTTTTLAGGTERVYRKKRFASQGTL